MRRFAQSFGRALCALALTCGMAGSVSAAIDADILQDLSAFDQWTHDYQTSPDPGTQAAREATGVVLAQKRRVALHSLIQTDPEAAITHALRASSRSRLPASVQALLEQRVDGMGLLTARVEMYHEVSVGDDGQEHPFHRAVRTPAVVLGEARYLPYTYGRRHGLMSTQPVPIHGIAIDYDLAVSELPYRDLDNDESVPGAHAVDGAKPCPGELTSPRIVSGNEIRTICSAAEVDALVQQWGITERDLMQGPAPAADIQSTYTTGSKTFLYIRVRFSDQDVSLVQDDAAAAVTMSGLKDFSKAFSFNALYDIVSTLTPILVLPQTQSYYVTSGDLTLLSDARTAATAAGFNPSTFNFYAVRFTGGPGGYAGQAYVGGTGIWLKTNSAGVLAHEFGHNLGLWHANLWVPAGADPIGAGTNSEYGNAFDRMGSGGNINAHFTASAKEILTWLRNKELVRLWGSGNYRFASHDVTAPPAIGAAAYFPRVRYWMGDAAATTPNNGQYWFEHRVQFSQFVRAVHMNTSGTANWFVDNTPQSMGGMQDGGLVLGRTYADPMLGLYVTPIDKQDGTPAGAPSTITLRVNSGAFPGNHAPTVTLTPSNATPAVNASITLTASASDADGDPLSYSWEWGDFTLDGVNAASVTKAWSTAGHYRVRVTATDMKGGTASASTVITVGTPPATALRGSGQVTLNGVGVEGVHVWNGATGSSYRGAYTTSDGTYMIPRLAAGAVTLSASKKGLTIVSQFTNPVNFTADTNGLNFTATELPVVALSTLNATALPNGTDTLVFRLSRSGPTTNPLKVFFVRGGTAFSSGNATPASSDDYTPSTGTNNFATIPANAATLDIVMTSRLDTTPDEPDETVTVDLAQGIDYEVSYPGRGQGVITGLAAPPNDAFVNRIALSGAPLRIAATNRYATLEFNEPPHNGRTTGSGSVWWSWTAPSDGMATVDTIGTVASAVDTVAAVYTGTSLAQLIPIAVNNDVPGVTNSLVTFPVTAGGVYQIAIANAAVGALGGNLKLNISLGTSGSDVIFKDGFQ